MHEDRHERTRAQTELVSNYAATPIGMFTLGSDNIFQRANPVLEQMLGFSLNGDTVIHWTDYFENQDRSEEHTSELQSLMRISYAVFCLKKKKKKKQHNIQKKTPLHNTNKKSIYTTKPHKQRITNVIQQ